MYQTPPAVPTDKSAPLVVPDPLNSRYSYGGSKIISELLAINAGRTGLSASPSSGPTTSPDMAWEHVVPQFCLRAMDLTDRHRDGPLPFPIQGDGTQTRAFTHIDDMIDGLMLVVERGEHLNVYHVGNPEELSIGDVARRVVTCFGREARIIPSELPQGSTNRRCPDVGKLKALGSSRKSRSRRA